MEEDPYSAAHDSDNMSAAMAMSSMSSPSRRVSWKVVDPQRANSNFKVVIRTRPPLPRELNGERAFQNVVGVDRVRQGVDGGGIVRNALQL